MHVQLWQRGLAYGVALWIVAFLVAALLAALGLPGTALPVGVVLLLVTVYVTWVFAARIPFVSVSQGVGIGVFWLVLNVVLDGLVIVVGFHAGFEFFRLWVNWGRYLLLFVIPPLLASRRRSS